MEDIELASQKINQGDSGPATHNGLRERQQGKGQSTWGFPLQLPMPIDTLLRVWNQVTPITLKRACLVATVGQEWELGIKTDNL